MGVSGFISTDLFKATFESFILKFRSRKNTFNELLHENQAFQNIIKSNVSKHLKFSHSFNINLEIIKVMKFNTCFIIQPNVFTSSWTVP